MTGSLDDATRPVGAKVEPDDEATAISRRGAAGAGLDDTVRSAATTSAPGPRRRAPIDDPGPVEVPDDGWTDDGSTVVADASRGGASSARIPARGPAWRSRLPGSRSAHAPDGPRRRPRRCAVRHR